MTFGIVSASRVAAGQPGAHAGLGAVLSLLHFVDHTTMFAAAVGEVPGRWYNRPYRLVLATVSLIAPHPRIIAVQKIWQDRAVGHVGGGGNHGMDHLGRAINADMRLHAKRPLIALARLIPPPDESDSWRDFHLA